ncbi:MAG TPA: winged helix-turn-helix domain-containing protein [Bacteroidales bacterium]|nr:winged helix-turn-helix domain-containing protein [Acetomicrobium sp.]HRT84121.1 winged helix-turn-helix domain-containing protein [Bacteroidales bacterium]
MPIPPEKDILTPLLHLIHIMGGEVKPSEVYETLANYFRLTEKERQEVQPSGLSKKFENRVRWARNSLCKKGFLDRTLRGVWKITEKGKKELSRLGLINKPFPVVISPQGQDASPTHDTKDRKSEDEEILELILDEIAPEGPKQFPDDFLDSNCTDFYEIEIPGTQLHLATKTETVLTSPKGYFRYQAKNPPEAKYILYAHNVGNKKVKIPRDNLALFKTVKAYEKYCDELVRRAFELFLEFTCDEGKAEEFTNKVAIRLRLKVKLPILRNGYE